MPASELADTSAAIVMVLQGHLTRSSLLTVFADAGPQIDRAACERCLIVDCLTMTGYDPDARSEFVRWVRERKPLLRCVAIVTDKVLWRMVVGAMGLASQVPTQAFDTRDQAEA